MGLTAERLRAGLDALAAIEPGFAAGLARHGYPEPRLRAPGHETMLRTILGQQVSVASANAIWGRMEAAIGAGMDPVVLAAAPDELLRSCGLSRQKSGYVKSLAELVAAGEIDFAALPADDEAAIASLVRIRGIGRWSAEIYLLFAEGRGDIWPAGDLAVQEEVGQLLGHEMRPSEKRVRELGGGLAAASRRRGHLHVAPLRAPAGERQGGEDAGVMAEVGGKRKVRLGFDIEESGHVETRTVSVVTFRR